MVGDTQFEQHRRTLTRAKGRVHDRKKEEAVSLTTEVSYTRERRRGKKVGPLAFTVMEAPAPKALPAYRLYGNSNQPQHNQVNYRLDLLPFSNKDTIEPNPDLLLILLS